ncbi:MAG TPA: sigma-70 family RNA polymerase sigma factor [Chryseolinea sp.]
MADKTEDNEILRLLKANDQRAITLLYDAHFKTVFKYVNQYLNDEDESFEIVQKLFINIWTKRHELNVEKTLRNYLVTAAYNRALNLIKQKKRQNEIYQQSYEDTSDESPGVDVEYEFNELQQIIRTVLNAMPEKAALAYKLNRDEGLTYREIATRLNVTEKAIEKSISKVLRLLRFAVNRYLNKKNDE